MDMFPLQSSLGFRGGNHYLRFRYMASFRTTDGKVKINCTIYLFKLFHLELYVLWAERRAIVSLYRIDRREKRLK